MENEKQSLCFTCDGCSYQRSLQETSVVTKCLAYTGEIQKNEKWIKPLINFNNDIETLYGKVNQIIEVLNKITNPDVG